MELGSWLREQVGQRAALRAREPLEARAGKRRMGPAGRCRKISTEPPGLGHAPGAAFGHGVASEGLRGASASLEPCRPEGSLLQTGRIRLTRRPKRHGLRQQNSQLAFE